MVVIISNVPSRLRKESPLGVINNAIDLRIQLTKWAMSERNIPKRYRFLISVPIVQKCNELIDNLTAGHSIYATNDEELQMRRNYQTEALINIEQLLQYLQFAIELFPINIEKLGPTIDMLSVEHSKIKTWKKNNKMVPIIDESNKK